MTTNFDALDNILNPSKRPARCAIPHRRRLRAVAVLRNVTYELSSNWPRTRWYLKAKDDAGWQHGHVRSTGSSTIAEGWLSLFDYDDLRDTMQKFTVRRRDGYTVAP